MEGFEEVLLLLIGNAGTCIGDGHLDEQGIGIADFRRDIDSDIASAREFYGVADQVSENLLESNVVDFDREERVQRMVEPQDRLVLLGSALVERFDVLEDLEKIGRLGHEFEALGFNFRQVENVVDDAQQGLGAIEDRLNGSLIFWREARLDE